MTEETHPYNATSLMHAREKKDHSEANTIKKIVINGVLITDTGSMFE